MAFFTYRLLLSLVGNMVFISLLKIEKKEYNRLLAKIDCLWQSYYFLTYYAQFVLILHHNCIEMLDG